MGAVVVMIVNEMMMMFVGFVIKNHTLSWMGAVVVMIVNEMMMM